MKTEKSASTPSTNSKKQNKRQKVRWKVPLKRWGQDLKTKENCGQQALHYNNYQLSIKEWILYSGQGILLCAIITYVFYRNIWVFLILLPIGILYPIKKRVILCKKRLEKLNLEFKEGMLALSSALSAGYSAENAFVQSIQELTLLYGEEGYITREFNYMIHQMRMNQRAEQVVEDFAIRSGLDDVENFAEVFAIAKRSGGDLVHIINNTVGTISEKIRVKEEIITLISSKQFEQRIMNIVPFAIVIYVDITSPGFFDVMYSTWVGRIVMSICLAVYMVSFLLAERFIRIEV